jgi:tetratricopeptide (TPR) repeat protein
LALRSLGRTVEAEKMLSELVKIPADKRADALYVAGLVERARNNPDAARGNFRRALESDPFFWRARLAISE